MENLHKIIKSKDASAGIYFIDKKEEFLSYSSLYTNSLKLLNYFNSKGIKRGSKLIFQFSTNKNFVTTFWANACGGIVSVPVSTGNNDEHRLKLFNIYDILDDAFLIIDSDILDKLEVFATKNGLIDKFEDIKNRTIDIRDIDLDTLDEATPFESDKDDLVLIQFSSGSTGDPKGVKLTHNNIIQNAFGFLETAEITEDDSYLSWFPLTHDMGLMGWHINPLILGVNQVLIETNIFIRRPLLWMDSATKFKSTILCSPNFGYRYLLKFLKKEQNWDLSNIRLIFNGAEPISADLCDEFLDTLKPYGLDDNSMYTVYGLAEATLAVAFPRPSEKFRRYHLDINYLNIGAKVKDIKVDIGSVTYVDVGYPLTNMQIRTANNGKVLDEDFIGHVEMKSISVTDGYYNNIEATQSALSDDGWFDTGDLGFIRDGRLIITGRAKDIIIINGTNFYPHDIEDISCTLDVCELNRVVAIGARDANQEDEKLVIFVLFKKELTDFLSIQDDIKKVILNKIGLEVSQVIPVKNIYKTTSGKLQRFKFLQKYSSGEFDDVIKKLNMLNNNDLFLSQIDILDILLFEASEILGSKVDMDKPLFEQGFSSISLVSFKDRVSKRLDIEIDITTIFDYPTIRGFANFLSDSVSTVEGKSDSLDTEIAIVSVACQFPDASSPEEFFDNLLSGVDSVKKSSRWSQEYHGGFLDEETISSFDNNFFNISIAEANTLDPQEKILLQTALSLFERGGVDYSKEKNIGVYIGVSSNDNLRLELGKDLSPYTLTSNLISTLSGRLSYYFDFKAPALSLDTACSSSLVAIHQAINGIKNGDCKIAMAGGVNVILDALSFEGLNQLQALSPSNRCRTFDEDADGYIRGEGCGLVLLKPLNDAIKSKDDILGVIKSSTLNHDGKSNGLTAPNGLSQQSLLKKAYANIDRVDFIETHGTGTKLGDPIEINALSSVLGNQEVLLGAVKTNIGHLEASAGVAGVIKTLMAMKYKKLPANLHLKSKNPYIDWDKINLKPITKNLDWNTDRPKVAGVSSFGFSGTNAHIVLEEYQQKDISKIEKEYKVLLVSTKEEDKLEELANLYSKGIDEDNLDNFIYTSSQKYRYAHKMAMVGSCADDFKSQKSIFKSTNTDERTKSIFVFTGQGSHYPNMAKELFEDEPIFREYFLECDKVFGEYIEKSLVDIIFADNEPLLDEPIYTQASIFTVEYALAKYLIALNVKPDGVTGHSLGEYVASTIAGILSLKDAVRLVLVRSKLISTIDTKGAMYLFMSSEEEIFYEINRYYDKLSIASVNSPRQVVVSGEQKTLEKLAKELKDKGIKSIKLNINQAYHSVLLDSILFDFYYEATKITYNKAQIPFISAMKAMSMDELDENYFSIHFRNSVRFADTIEYLNTQKYNTFIEIGPDAHLSSLIMQQSSGVTVIPTLRKNRALSFYDSLATLYTNNFDIDWDKFYLGFGQKMAIPTHPLKKDSFALDYSTSQVALAPQKTKVQVSTKTNSQDRLKELIYQVSGIKEIAVDINLFELGLDSLSLFQLRESAKKEFGVEIEMKEFYMELNTLNKFSKFIDKNSTVEMESSYIETPTLQSNNSNQIANLSDRELIKEQLDSINNLTKLFDTQLSTLKGEYTQTQNIETLREIDPEVLKNAQLKTIKKDRDDLTTSQQTFVDEFIIKYNQKTQKSKEFAKRSKEGLTDWINTVIYRQSLKEINYPIVATSANGAKFVDSDDNSFVDISMGYGAVFLGHNHPKVKEAMSRVLDSGFVLAPQNEMAKEVADIIREFTNTQKVTFSNTGTEAVMAVLRMVRAKSKKTKIVKFQGSFHGTSDTILNSGDENGSFPTSLGVNQGSANDIFEFAYGSPKIFDFLRENHHQIAGVLVEPVQSRRVDFQPIEFLKELREVTKELGIALIFDEMITAFRCARGGASEIFGIKPDIFTFGKVVGGTMPIGIIAGDKEYLDVIDGGDWEFGDDSYPIEDMMSFGGTFCKHPLTLSASLATLKVLQDNPNIQKEVNAKTDYLADELNLFFTQNSFPIKLNHFGSLFRFDFYGEYSAALNPIEIDMFFYMLIYKGVYTWEKRVCFLSASHTKEDLDFIIDKSKETLFELKERGFFNKIKSHTHTMEATSFQKRLYILSQFENSSSIYNMSMAWRVDDLDIDKTQKVFSQILLRHPSLRTNLYIDDGIVYQRVNSHKFILDILDADDIETQINSFLDEEFDLEKQLLFRALVIKEQNSSILVIKTHHTIFDGPSIDIVMEDFDKLYFDKDISLPKRDYFDFSLEYERLLVSPKLKKQESFWLEKFGTTPVLNLPIDKPYPTNRTFKGDVEQFTIDNLLTTKLRDIAKGYKISINMLLYGCFSILLNKITSQDDITIGIPVTLRDGEYADVVGMFANTVAIRESIDEKLNISSYMKEVQKSFLETLDNINYPFEELVERLDIEKDLARNALFDVMFIYEDGSKRLLDGMGFEKYNLEKKASTFDLVLEVIDEGETLFCSYEYYSDIFDSSTIKQFITYFIKILDEIKEDKSLKDIDIIPKDEILLLDSFNQTQKEYSKDKTIVDLFELQVKQNPDNIAVVYGEKSLTYEELNQKSNQLANYLIDSGVRVENIVAIKIDRSLEMIIGILGILKAGGAYLPIDMEYPKDRVEFVLDDSKAKTVVSLETFKEIKNYSKDNPDKDINPNNLAYIIYTSGSTGRPKGVMIEHRNVVSFSLNMSDNFNIKPRDTIYAITTISFDISVLELISSLLSNLQVVISSNNLLEDNLQEIADNDIDIIQTTPSRYKAFMDLDKESLRGVKKLLIGGEKLSSDVLDRLKELDCELYNVYGPTEATVWSSYKRVDNAVLDIGKPLFNESAYILDINLNQVPLGAIGELYIAGDGLARGYLDRPELTNEVFINHPKLGRIYKTGDMARYKKDGNIAYLGRVDDQVKIRGFRIELGEIESAILEYDSIKESVVIAKDEQLIAYIIGEEEELKEHLKGLLPNYMVPSFFIKLESMPLTPNGKIDKKSLPSPNKIDAQKVYIEATTSTQKDISDIFCEVLRLDKVSIDDNFFDIGGHSLNAMSVIAKISKALSVDMKLKDLFKYSNVDELSRLVDSTNRVEYIDILPIEIADSYEVSNSQRRLWVLDKISDGNNIYNMAGALEFESALDIGILSRSLTILVERHEILRTNFKEIDQKLRQVVNPSVDIDIKEVNIESVDEYLVDIASNIFDLQSDRLIDIELINQNILFVNMHHIISDGWSISVIIKELSEIYTALSENKEPKLEPLTIQYKDYTHWQNSMLEDEEYLNNNQKYWHNLLDNHTPLDFPLDFTRPTVQTFNGKTINFTLDKSRVDRLNMWTKNSTLFSVLLTITNILLSKYSSLDDIILGTPIANRTHEKLFNQIGFYVNTIVLRNKIELDKSFEYNLLNISKDTLEAFEHQSYPFDKLVDELGLDRDLSQNPLFNMMIVLQNNEESELSFNGNMGKDIEVDSGVSKFDMTFNYTPIDEEIELDIEYNRDLFERSTIERLFTNLETLIDNITNNKNLDEINIISKDEKLLLDSFNQTQKEYPKDKTIIELFEEQVEKTPNNIAVVYEDMELSYRELNSRANQLGTYLRETYDIKPDTIIPIMADRGEWMIISLLGVLKSGGAYLPLDPEYPRDRIEYMISDSRAKMLIIDKDNIFDFNIPTLNINKLDYSKKSNNLNNINSSKDLAYVIYTSGSTGKPKGVMVENKSILNTIFAQIDDFNITKDSRLLQFASFSFDAFISEVFTVLLSGATLITSDKDEIVSNFSNLIKDKNVNIATLPPSFLSSVDTIGNLKIIITAGESAIIKDAIKYSKEIEYINAYGPTENSICTLLYKVNPNKTYKTIPIGKPISNTNVYILDQMQTQLPLGAIGELCIAGDGLARGYLNQPELTAEKFITHPTLGRIYKTGDIAKYHTDGNLEYLGRVDDQVKIRGFRIELGEIENSILSFDNIKEAVVLAKEQQLIAYVVENSKSAIEELKTHLKTKLPSYMIPSYFISIDSLPLTPNGKIDKKALPKPNEADNHKVYIEASNENEKRLATIFCEVLKVDRVSMYDNFFEIGGHSLTAITTIAKVSKTFSVEIKLKELFIYNSIEGLAKLIESKTEVEYIEILPLEPQKSYEISNAQRRLWVLDKMQDGTNAYNIPGALSFKENLNIKILQESINQLVNRHEILRTNFKEIEGEVRQVIKESVSIEIEEVELKEDEVDAYLVKEATTVFDLEKDRLISVKVINKNILFVNMHHIISDGWSIAIIIKELSTLYTALDNNQEVNLKPLTIQYKEYAHWQNSILEDKTYLEKHQNYWHEALKGHQTLEFPLDYSRPSSQSFEGASLNFRLNRQQCTKLKNFTKNSTLFSVLLTITNILLSKYSNQEDILLGTPIANRGHEQLFDQIGFYVNTLALRTKLDISKSFEENLLNITAKTLEAFEHQSYPFDKLVDELDLELDLSQNPLFNMMIILQNNEQSELNFSNNQTDTQDIDTKSAKFDMTFSYMEIEDEIVLNIEYNTTLFKSSTIERLFLNLETLIENITNITVLNELNIISKKEKKLLKKFNQTKKDYPKDKTIIELFEEQVRKTPNNIAVVYEEIELSYEELNKRANQLGHYLREKHNIQADTLVPIIVNRSEWMIIAILGVLKAGGAYLPIDPEYPKDRISYILEDSKATLLICDGVNYSKATSLEINVIEVESLKYNNAINNLKIINKASDLAYVIYTSGSTGLPKGVMVEHRGVVNAVLNQIEIYGMNSSIRLLQFTTFMFDVSVSEILTTLFSGATLITAKKDKIINEFNILIKENKINMLNVTPSFLQSIDNKIEGLKVLVTAGESATVSDALKYAQNSIYINAYGPTETFYVSLYQVNPNKSYKTIPIGKPIANTKLYILDQAQHQLPLGGIGELYIAGDGLARGYLNKPELTQKVFINHSKLGRIYKTGDIAKYHSDGNIEYLGRVDDQVKIRGFRIELGEIENSILSFKGIKESVVLAKEQQLIAYIVEDKDKNSKNTIEALKAYLKIKLPFYMIPSYFISIDFLPLTSNGKIDKKALPKPNEEDNKVYIEASNENEKILSSIFCEVLKVDRVSMDDNFFEIGGHSLSAIMFISKANQKLNSNLNVKDIFRYGNIKEIANFIEASQEEFAYKEFVITQSHRDNIDKPFSLTNVQQAYLFGREEHFEMGNVSTHVYAETIFSHLNIDRLEKSLNILLKRYEALRLIFNDGKQSIAKDKIYKIVSHGEIDDKGLKDIRDRLSHKIYDLEKAPLMDIEVSYYNQEIILHFSMDALLMDASSMMIFFDELEKLYIDLSYELKPLELTFQDYMLAYDKVRDSELFDNAKAYWSNKLYDYSLEYNLPYQVTPSSVKEPKFNRCSKNIDKETWRRFKKKINQEGLGLTSAILAIYAEVLCYFSNQENFTLNLTLFNRLPLHEQVNDILGDFTVLELFNYQKQNNSILEILKSSHNTLWDDLEHILYDGIDFQREIRKEFKIDSSKIIAPIVLSSILKGDDGVASDLGFEGYLREGYSITQTPQVYLDNKAYQDSEGNFVAEWDYVEQLFDRETIECMHHAYCKLIETIANANWYDSMPVLNLPKKDKLLIEEINHREDKRLLNSLKPLPELFKEQVKRNKLATAVIDRKGSYSYESIDNYSNAIAVTLNKLNVNTQEGIAIYSEKGYQEVVSTLGIMKAGKFYLPLGSSPVERIKEILTEAQVNIILVSKSHYKKIKELKEEYTLLIIEEIKDSNSIEEELTILPIPTLKDIAYVIYTSGSTGKPKGVIATHEGVANTILAVNDRFNINEKDKAFAISQLSFDLSVYDIFGLLSAGGSIVFPDSKRREEPRYWCELIEAHQITLWNSVPQLATLLYDEAKENQSNLTSLKTILLSGDYIPLELPSTIKAHSKMTTVMSLGGATEGTIWSIWYEVEDVKDEWKTIPYGTAMPNQGIYILDKSLNPTPIGVKGELYITGTSVATGYYRDEERTKASFFNHPTLGYIYKTGDLGVLHPDGYYEFRGRDDSQVKIRGFRVELGEIENSILSFKGIKESVVLAKEQQLIAYVVEDKNIIEELKTYLKTKLPSYMIPSYFISMDSLPLTPNGKIDKKALPKPEMDLLSQEYKAPRNELEKELCAIFEDILSMENVGINSNFFDIGGDSIKAIRIISQINKLGYSVSVKEIFLSPTIEELVSVIDSSKMNLQNIPIQKRDVSNYYDLSYGQKGLFLLSSMNSDMVAYNIPIALSLEGILDLDAMQKAFDALLVKHEILKTRFTFVDGEPKQYISQDVDIKLSIEEIDEDEIDSYIDLTINHKFDLEIDNLIDVKLLNISDNRHILLVVIHHILVDGWSMGIIDRDIQNFYNAYKNSEIVEVYNPTINYRDYIAYQEDVLKNIEPQREYLLNQFSGFNNRLELPIDFAKSDNRTFDGGFTSLYLGKERSKRVRDIVKSQNKTLFTLFVSLIDVLLYLYSKEEDIVIGTPTNNIRQDERFQDSVGYYLNTLAIKSKIRREDTFLENFNNISMDIYNGFENSDYPLDKLIEDLKLSSSVDKNPLFSVMVILQNFEQHILNFDGLEVGDLNSTRSGSKFDLQFEFTNSEDIFLILEYSLDLFKKQTIIKVRDNFIILLDLILDDMELSLDFLERELNLDKKLETIVNINQEIDEDF